MDPGEDNAMISRQFGLGFFLLSALGVLSGLGSAGEARAEGAEVNCHDVIRGVQHRYNGYDSWRIMNITITDAEGQTKTRRILAAHQNIGIHRRNCSTHPSAAYHIESARLSPFGRKLTESSRNSKATVIL